MSDAMVVEYVSSSESVELMLTMEDMLLVIELANINDKALGMTGQVINALLDGDLNGAANVGKGILAIRGQRDNIVGQLKARSVANRMAHGHTS